MQSVEKIRLPNMFAVSIRKHSVWYKNAGCIQYILVNINVSEK